MNGLLLTFHLLLAANPDPRIQLVELQVDGQVQAALRQTESLLRDDPTWAHANGLDYLRGHFLDQLDLPRDAVRAYALALQTTPALRPATHLRLAISHANLGHPEVAAGILVGLLNEPAPAALATTAARFLIRTLTAGGDCRVLSQLGATRLGDDSRRRVQVARIACDLDYGGPAAGRPAQGGPANAGAALLDLLSEQEGDLAAKQAADLLVGWQLIELDSASRAMLGSVFHRHRDFDNAIAHLEPTILTFSQQIGSEEFDLYYRLVRSYYWSGRFEQAVAGYSQLAQRTPRTREQAQALYQQGRSLERMGEWAEAAKSYRRSYVTDRDGRLAGANLISALRLEWRSGHEESTTDLLEILQTDRRLRSELSRALIFLASSNIVRGRSERAGHWLSQADSGGSDGVEVAYWRGRLSELESDIDSSVQHYLEALRRDPYHPMADAARGRLRSPALVEATFDQALVLARSRRTVDLAIGWLLLDSDHPQRLEVRRELGTRLAQNRASSAFLTLAPVAPADWPIWQRPHDEPEEKFLALGLWREAGPVVRRHFPLNDLALAFTASHHLARSGDTERSLYIAEILSRRLPAAFPPWMLPHDFRTLLYPLPYGEEITQAARRFDVDPHLMLAILREESRFDPTAASAASARGLGQFILATAQSLAAAIGHTTLAPVDLEDPAISIQLNAALLARLAGDFDGRQHSMIAAYNAGEEQARLWTTYCYSREPEEYFSKVSFPETRDYLERVLRSRAHYREIHGSLAGVAP